MQGSGPGFFSEKAKRTGAAPISYLMAAAVTNKDLISLAAGLVDYATLPAEEARDALNGLLADPARANLMLQYGTTEGLTRLREQVLERYLDGPARGALSVDEVVVGTGSQQLLYLVGEELLDPGDIVFLPAPSYFVFMGALESMGARAVGIPMDEEGMRVDVLAGELQRLSDAGELAKVKLVYVATYFQNPTGLSLSGQRRRQLLEVIRRFSTEEHRIFIVEDAAYRELRCEGEDTPPIKHFDQENRHVVYLGTFSKPFSPGLKTGFGFFPKELVSTLLHLKGSHDFGSANFCQHLLSEVLESGALEEHVAVLRRSYRRKRDCLLGALERHLAPGVRYVVPRGGLYVWVEMEEGVNTGRRGAYFQACLEDGVLFVPGEYCFAPEGPFERPDNCIRLCYAVPSEAEIEEGVARMGRALQRLRVRGAGVTGG
ncbi:MAG: PLP-dependent aminotransferase family protein [Planctomycetes bacterium]|nr:PLP-dependent aminotransferase family protein [Planctomycetota bacterium]